MVCPMSPRWEVLSDSLSALPPRALSALLFKSGNLGKVGNGEMKGISELCPFPPTPSVS